jgi:hypothetical protein
MFLPKLTGTPQLRCMRRSALVKRANLIPRRRLVGLLVALLPSPYGFVERQGRDDAEGTCRGTLQKQLTTGQRIDLHGWLVPRKCREYTRRYKQARTYFAVLSRLRHMH